MTFWLTCSQKSLVWSALQFPNNLTDEFSKNYKQRGLTKQTKEKRERLTTPTLLIIKELIFKQRRYRKHQGPSTDAFAFFQTFSWLLLHLHYIWSKSKHTLTLGEGGGYFRTVFGGDVLLGPWNQSINQLYLNTVNGSASWFSDMPCDNYNL